MRQAGADPQAAALGIDVADAVSPHHNEAHHQVGRTHHDPGPYARDGNRRNLRGHGSGARRSPGREGGADKETLTEQEAAEYAKLVIDARNIDRRRQIGQNSDVISAYNLSAPA